MLEMSSQRANVLHAYRRLIQMAKLAPQDKRKELFNQIRTGFRANREESSPEKLAEMMQKASSSLSFLKIMTPRSKYKKSSSDGVTRIVFGAGKDENSGGRKAMSNWTGSNMDPDSVKRHYQSLNRMGFMNNSQAKGIF